MADIEGHHVRRDLANFREEALIDAALTDLVEAGSPDDETETGIHYTQDLFEPNINRLHFDQVTRTYVMKLEIENAAELPADPELRVEFHSMNDVEMRVSKRMDPPDS